MMKRTLVLMSLAFSTILFGFAQTVVVNNDGPVTAPGLHVTGDVGYALSGQLQQRTEAGVAGGNVIFNGEPLLWAESAHPGATVKGAPYSATAVTEVTQVLGEGHRTTITIPAGQIGNERPLQIINEVWFSPDLKIIVLSKRNDPRFGETVYRLTTINRAEPDSSLFQVPAGYSVDSSLPRIERRA